jgi:Putative Actinobacterial Holin-X, holin superfamily III
VIDMATNPKAMPPSSDASMADLLRRLIDDLSTLVRQELALARAEITHSVGEAKTGLTGVAAGGAVLYTGVLALIAAGILALAEVMPAWGAALIVGALLAIVGYAMLSSGRKKLRPANLKPEQTQESLRKDKHMFERRPS